MKTVEILEEARNLLSEPSHWAKGYFAFNADKDKVSGISGNAVCWCMLGAIWKVAGDETNEVSARSILETCVPHGEIAPFNDAPDTTHDQVLAAFDCAIDKARAVED